jgi:adenylate cyclase
MGSDWKSSHGARYIQGYLNSDKERIVRVRLTEEKAFLCVKGATQGATRPEFEYEIPTDDAEQLLKLCAGAVIQKIRHTVIHKGLTWEIDKFLGDNKGLLIAEVELTSEDQVFDKPEWLGQEVTGDPHYFNSNLAANPYKKWRDKNL